MEVIGSVVGLLVSAIGDANGRLKEIVGESRKVWERDGVVSPVRGEKDGEKCRSGECSEENNLGMAKKGSMKTDTKARSMAGIVSFAPIPSHLTRFAARVDAISTALNDARVHLEEWAAAIRDSFTYTLVFVIELFDDS